MDSYLLYVYYIHFTSSS